VTGARAGDPLPFSPEWTFGLTADYARPLGGDWEAVVGGSYSFQGERFSSFSGPTLNTNILIPSFDTLDLRVGLRSTVVDLMLRVDNITDERGITSLSVGRVLATQNLPAVATIIRPRTITLALTGRF
jgi:outer membrane receptor protein involved in Fe transport